MIMNEVLKIEKMQKVDLDDIMEIEQASFSDAWAKEGFLQSIDQPYSLMLTAKFRDKVVGYCCLYCILDEGEIINVAVHPQWRGKGVGTQMLDSMLAMGKEQGVMRFLLDVRVSNYPAQKLYENAGFVKIACQKNFYEMPVEDGWLMELLL